MSFKCIFITGGVVSSLGKGLTAASLAMILERYGLKIGMLKLDPYLNVDPGTMNPFEHGEVYVTDDGAETDLDLGHYHRFLQNASLSKYSTASAGQIYSQVLNQERQGSFLGKTIQVIPHITNCIIQAIRNCAEQSNPDILIVEIGGTTGDIESQPFLEAIRQFRQEHTEQCINIHMTYVPFLKAAGEFKSKPTQHSTQTLRSLGIFPDAIFCRSEQPIPNDIKKKISLFCNIHHTAVFNLTDVDSVYALPIALTNEGVDQFLARSLHLPSNNHVDLSDVTTLLQQKPSPNHHARIGVIGKYTQHKDAYKSIFEALTHASLQLNCHTEIIPIDSESLENNSLDTSLLASLDGILVPGGFGQRGWKGKIKAAQYSREHNIPYLGICLGLQDLVTEFAKHVCQLHDANSLEMNPETPHPVVCLMDSQQNIVNIGGTMRLGQYRCHLSHNTLAHSAYQQDTIQERHRHRYEVNPKYLDTLRQHGLIISGVSDQGLCESVEVPNHPWMVGVQFHPEFLSKLLAPHPLFTHFISAALQFSQRRRQCFA